MWETRVQSLVQEDPLEKELATHSGALAWRIPWTEEPGRLQSMWSLGVRHDRATSLSLFHQWWFIGKSCLTLETPWAVACQAPLSMGFSRQEYWSG